MFLRATIRKKDGKEHRYWSVVENRRLSSGRVVQRHVLYLGEINSSQELAWRKSIEVLEDGSREPRSLALFPEDRCEGLLEDASIVRLRLSELSLRRPRQWGACWLALMLWQELGLDEFWAERLAASRKGTRWDRVLFVLVAYRLIAPGSEWRLHREWFGRSALADLLGGDEALADPHALYGCHDRLLAHKEALFSHLVGRRRCSATWSGAGGISLTSASMCCSTISPAPTSSPIRRWTNRISVVTATAAIIAATACRW